MFENFFGNPAAVAALEGMVRRDRIPHTILLGGPEGVGKATLARRLAAHLLGDASRIERDDLSLDHNIEVIAEREKWPSNKRDEDPLLFSTHPDFVTFPPDGPLRQLSIQQMRLLKERSLFKPLRGNRRVFLIDHIDRANEQAANSLLKTLEEPPEHLLIVATASNPYDLLPTIRSRSILLHLAPVDHSAMLAFARARGLADAERRVALAAGSPGLAVSLDIENWDHRRAAMLALLQAAARKTTFGAWARQSEAIAAARDEKLDAYLKVLYSLLEDVLVDKNGAGGLRNFDIAGDIRAVASAVSFEWIRAAAARSDELLALVRRNIQKSIALDALVVEMRGHGGAA